MTETWGILMTALRSLKDRNKAASVMRLYFNDECPRIGSGWRSVEIKVGNKWVYFTYPPTGAKAKLKLSDAMEIITKAMILIERSS